MSAGSRYEANVSVVSSFTARLYTKDFVETESVSTLDCERARCLHPLDATWNTFEGIGGRIQCQFGVTLGARFRFRLRDCSNSVGIRRRKTTFPAPECQPRRSGTETDCNGEQLLRFDLFDCEPDPAHQDSEEPKDNRTQCKNRCSSCSRTGWRSSATRTLPMIPEAKWKKWDVFDVQNHKCPNAVSLDTPLAIHAVVTSKRGHSATPAVTTNSHVALRNDTFRCFRQCAGTAYQVSPPGWHVPELAKGVASESLPSQAQGRATRESLITHCAFY
jgi:hypothetical protein